MRLLCVAVLTFFFLTFTAVKVFKQHAGDVKKRCFAGWVQQRRFSRILRAFTMRSARRHLTRHFRCLRRCTRQERRSTSSMTRMFRLLPQTKMRLALLHWRQISFAAVPLIRCKLCRVRAERWYVKVSCIFVSTRDRENASCLS